jgi:hypothetical protein
MHRYRLDYNWYNRGQKNEHSESFRAKSDASAAKRAKKFIESKQLDAKIENYLTPSDPAFACGSGRLYRVPEINETEIKF